MDARLALGPGSNRAFTVTDPTGPGHKALLYLVAASTGGPAERVPVRSLRHYI